MVTVDLVMVVLPLAENPPPEFPAVAFRMMSLEPLETFKPFSVRKPPHLLIQRGCWKS